MSTQKEWFPALEYRLLRYYDFVFFQWFWHVLEAGSPMDDFKGSWMNVDRPRWPWKIMDDHVYISSIHVFIHSYTYIYTFICWFILIYIYMCVCISVCEREQVWVCVCVYVCGVCVCVFISSWMVSDLWHSIACRCSTVVFLALCRRRVVDAVRMAWRCSASGNADLVRNLRKASIIAQDLKT